MQTAPIEQTQPPSSESFSKRVVSGGLWVFTIRFTNRGLGFVRTIVLARLLSPHDFGLLSIAMLAAGTLDYFSQTGFQSALIQKQDKVESFLDTAWTVLAVRGIFLFFILYLSAPLVSSFFNSPQATPIIRVIAISMILTGFRNIGIIFFSRQLEFDKQFKYEFTGMMTDLIISVILAFTMRDVWALVWGGLSGNIVRLFMSYKLHPFRPRIKIDGHVFKELSAFGRWILGSSILEFFILQGNDIFIGKILGATALGFYQMAFLLANLSASEIAGVILRVTFPVYAKMREDLSRISEAYLNVLQLTAFISMPVAVGIFSLAPELIKVFLGSKWLQIIDAIRILAIGGLLSAITATIVPILYGIGQPQIDTLWKLARMITSYLLIYPLALQLNIIGVSVAVISGILVQTLGLSFAIIKSTGCKTISFFKMIILPLMNSTIMLFIITILKNKIHLGGFIGFFILMVSGIISYLLGTVLLDRFFNYGIRKALRERLADLIT